MRIRFFRGPIVLPDAVFEDGSVSVEDGRIIAVGAAARPGDIEVDLDGRTLIPGLVDLHGDAIEKEVEPRPNAFFPLPVAFNSIDRRCAAAGITTVFHGISFAEGELGVRDTRVAERVARELHAFAPLALVDHRVHVRYEITDPVSEGLVTRLIEDGIASLLSFMDHTPGQGQFKDVAAYKAYFGKVYRTSEGDIDSLIDRKQGEAGNSLDRMQRLAKLALRHGVALAGHDDQGRDRVELMRALGAAVSEFPCDLATARAAHEAGLATLFGAPNVVRGKSLSGALSARDAIAAGVASCLCSDYAPQALLPAIGTLVGELGLSWPEAIRLVASTPCKAAGLDDRGEIAVGQSADLLVVSKAQGVLVAESVWRQGHNILTARARSQCGAQ